LIFLASIAMLLAITMWL